MITDYCVTCLYMFDGHHGSGAARYAKNNLLNNGLHATTDEWIAVLPGSLVAAFVKTDKDLQAAGKSGLSLLTLFM